MIRNKHRLSIFRNIVGSGVLLLITAYAHAVNTHIQTDGTLSGITELTVNAAGSGQVYTLSELHGKLAGQNLFYSFSDFNIGTGDAAWFNLNTPHLAHVISRVTGGAESLIDGKLQMTNGGSAPSLYFLNPAGITFSSGASVDVPGSFYVSTASGLHFNDGSQFAANETTTSSLSSANPESFGFLGNELGSINIGSLETKTTQLTFDPGTDAVFVASRMQIDNTKIVNGNSSSQTRLDLQLITTGTEAGNIQLNALPGHATSGDLALRNTQLLVEGNGLGQLGIRSGVLTMKDSGLIVGNIGNVSMPHDQGIDIGANSLIFDNTSLGIISVANGDSGNIKIATDSLRLINKSFIGSHNSEGFSGKNGGILIEAKEMEIDSASILGSTQNDKDGGSLAINADSLKLSNKSFIANGSMGNATGKSGDVTIKTRGLEINNLSMIGSNTNSNGNGGIVTVITDELRLNNSGQIVSTTIGNGHGGAVNVDAKLIVNNDRSVISAITAAEGNAGNVTVIADSIELNNMGSVSASTSTGSKGHGGSVTIHARNLEINDGLIDSRTFGEGNAGSIVVAAESLKVNNNSDFDRGIFSSSAGNSKGDAGSVTVDAKHIDINGALIASDTGGLGNAGNVIITSDFLKLTNFGSISSSVQKTSKGNGGTVSINSEQLIVNHSFIDSRTFNDGNAGNLIIASKSLELSDSGRISSSSGSKSLKPQGNAGSVSIHINELEISNAFIGSEAYGDGNAGQLNVDANSIQLHENGFLSTSTFGQGNAGNIIMKVNSLTAHGMGNPLIDLSPSNLLTGVFSSATADSGGRAGTIEINAIDTIRLNNGAQISIKNDATVAEDKLGVLAPTAINVDTSNLFLTNSRIAASSNGNADAGNIHIHFANQLFLDPSQITTAAANGNGGDITIQGDGTVFLMDSAVTTSVSGLRGNGGDITIAAAKGVILDSGFIQANTAASGASGGNVEIRTPALIPSGNSLFVGGSIPFQFQPFSGINVIQAAAPTGVSGTINAASPQLNLNSVMSSLVVESFDTNTLNRDMCSVVEGSSLMPSGKGSLPLRAKDFLILPVF